MHEPLQWLENDHISIYQCSAKQDPVCNCYKPLESLGNGASLYPLYARSAILWKKSVATFFMQLVTVVTLVHTQFHRCSYQNCFTTSTNTSASIHRISWWSVSVVNSYKSVLWNSAQSQIYLKESILKLAADAMPTHHSRKDSDHPSLVAPPSAWLLEMLFPLRSGKQRQRLICSKDGSQGQMVSRPSWKVFQMLLF